MLKDHYEDTHPIPTGELMRQLNATGQHVCGIRFNHTDKFCAQCGMPRDAAQRERTTGPMKPVRLVSPQLTTTGLHQALTKEHIQQLKAGQLARAVNHQVFQQQQGGQQ